MSSRETIDLATYIRTIPDFPKPGIQFKDISPLLADARAFAASIDRLAERFEGEALDGLAAIEARGFIFAAPLALRLRVGFVPIRKPGKLPHKTISATYELEYGSDSLEMHHDAIKPNGRYLLVDDVLATGGTMSASCDLIRSAGAEVAACAFLIELGYLNGRERLDDVEIFSLIRFED